MANGWLGRILLRGRAEFDFGEVGTMRHLRELLLKMSSDLLMNTRMHPGMSFTESHTSILICPDPHGLDGRRPNSATRAPVDWLVVILGVSAQ